MVVCLMRITSKTRKIIGISNAIFIGISILLQTLILLLKSDKVLEFYSIGIFQCLWSQDSLFLYSKFIASLLLLFSILLLVVVFDVTTSQESNHFHVGSRSYSMSIYLLFVSFILCVLSYALSLRVSAEFDTKMTKVLMNSYLSYGSSRSSRRLADRIHVEYSCCGVKSIEDFVDLSEIDDTLPTQTKLWPCNEWEYCGVPLSCCKSISCSQRVELLGDDWDPVNITEKWFNKKGCVEKMDGAFLFFNYPNYLLTDFTMIIVLGFHLCSLILTQVLVTASATLHGACLDSSEYSYAWLLDVGQPDPSSLIKKLNPGLTVTEFESSNADGLEEIPIEDGTSSEPESTTKIGSTTTLRSSSTDTSESKGSSFGTQKTTVASATTSVLETVLEKPVTSSTNETSEFNTNVGKTKKDATTDGKENKKVPKQKTKSDEHPKKPKTFKKPSGNQKPKHTKTTKPPKKAVTKKTNKKPSAKPKRK